MPKASHVDILSDGNVPQTPKRADSNRDPTNKTNPSLVDIYGIMEDTNDKFTVYLVYFGELLRSPFNRVTISPYWKPRK
jgi:hypothetical protein